MNIMIGGGSGFVGHMLMPALHAAGHAVYVIGRDKQKIRKVYSESFRALTWQDLPLLHADDMDVVINLAGANIAGKRWSETYKHEMLASRVETTKQLVAWCAGAKKRKPHFYTASAAGYYGLRFDTPDTGQGDDEKKMVSADQDHSFSSELVRQWEAAALSGEELGVPVTVMRFGVVLHHGEGMLKQLELPAKIGLGAVVGTGEQPVTWIDADDLVRAVLFLIERPEVTGVINLAAGYVSQKTFTQTMASVLHRSVWLRLPAWSVKILFGQMGEELLLSGQAVSPKRLTELGFTFNYPDLLSALRHEFGS